MKKEDLYNKCKLNDLIENYPQMLASLEEISKSEFEPELDDTDLYTRCFKCYIGSKRNQYRKIMALIAKDSLVDGKVNFHLLEILRLKLSTEIVQLCNRAIEICMNILKKLSNGKDKQKKLLLFFKKTIADHYRYIYEINEQDEYKTKASQFYEEAKKVIEEGKFSTTDITYLTFYLNYSVFLHDTMNNKTESMNVAKKCLHDALKDTEDITDNGQKDIVLLCQMIKDNLSLWKNEIPEELDQI